METSSYDFRPYKDALKSLAFKSENSYGRRYQPDKDEDASYYSIMDPFLLDYEKIRESKAYRRLFFKTQVVAYPTNCYIRNRGTHSNMTDASATRMASALGLNLFLTKAIACGHDLGHVPLGHLGERILTEILGREFSHEVFGVVVCQKIERKGRGLNLCKETLEGILHHSRGGGNLTVDQSLPLEYGLVMFADKIAYTLSDINDVVRAGILNEVDLPKCIWKLGKNHRERTLCCEWNLVKESAKKGYLSFSDSNAAKWFHELRYWMYDNVYYILDKQPDRILFRNYMKTAYDFLSMRKLLDCDPALILALMTDNEIRAIAKSFSGATIETLAKVVNLSHFGFAETIQFLQLIKPGINMTNPDLNWKTGYK